MKEQHRELARVFKLSQNETKAIHGNEIRALTNERNELQAKLAGIDDGRIELQNKLTKAIEERDESQTKLTGSVDERNELENKLADAHQVSNELQQKLSDANEKYNALQKQLSDAVGDHNGLLQKLSNTTERHTVLQKELSSAVAERDEVQKKLHELLKQRDGEPDRLTDIRGEDDNESELSEHTSSVIASMAIVPDTADDRDLSPDKNTGGAISKMSNRSLHTPAPTTRTQNMQYRPNSASRMAPASSRGFTAGMGPPSHNVQHIPSSDEDEEDDIEDIDRDESQSTYIDTQTQNQNYSQSVTFVESQSKSSPDYIHASSASRTYAGRATKRRMPPHTNNTTPKPSRRTRSTVIAVPKGLLTPKPTSHSNIRSSSSAGGSTAGGGGGGKKKTTKGEFPFHRK